MRFVQVVIIIGSAALVSLAACNETTVSGPAFRPGIALRDVGNPPPPTVDISNESSCAPDDPCAEVPCPLQDGDCFLAVGITVRLFVTPPSTIGSLEFKTSGSAISDGAQVKENHHAFTTSGTLTYVRQGTRLTIDMTSMHGSLLLTTDTGVRLVELEANAYYPNGDLYPRKFLYLQPF